jgi:hypothetical protein
MSFWHVNYPPPIIQTRRCDSERKKISSARAKIFSATYYFRNPGGSEFFSMSD